MLNTATCHGVKSKSCLGGGDSLPSKHIAVCSILDSGTLKSAATAPAPAKGKDALARS